MKRILGYILLAVMFLVPSFAVANAEVHIPAKPDTIRYVVDRADMLSDDTEKTIEAYGKALDDKTKAEIVVLTVDSLGGVPKEEYGLAVLRGWGIGDKELNNGVLLLIGRDDHKLRIEVGYGLEGAITDGLAGNILDTKMVPAFKAEKYDEGVLEGYAALLDLTLEEYKLTREDLGISLPENQVLPEDDDVEIDLMTIIGIIIMFAIVGVIYYFLFGGVHKVCTFIFGEDSYSDNDSSGGGGGGSYGGGSGGGGGAGRDW